MKKQLIVFILSMGLFGSVNAQYIPVSNQYQVNRFHINPAYAGVDETVNIFTGYRDQWTGLKGAPKTKMFNLNGPVSKHIGVGGDFTTDQAGFFTRFYGSLTYAYHIDLNTDHKLSFSLTGKVFEHSIDLTNATIDNPFDPILLDRQTQNETVLNAGASFLYRFKGLNVGFNVPYLMNNKSRYNSENNIDQYIMTRHYLGHASYDIKVGEDFGITPIGIIRFTEYAPFNYEFASQFKFKDQYWLCASFRKEGALGIGAGFDLNKRMIFNYTYEFLGNKMTGNTNGTHEFAVGLLFGKDVKKLKENQLLMQKQADSLAESNKAIKEDLGKMKEESAKEKQKMNAKLEILQQRLDDVEIETANLKTLSQTQQAEKKDEIDEEIAQIEKKLKEVGGQFFVVVEAFKIPENAKKSIDIWKLKGIEAKMIYNEVRDYYYIYVGKYPTYNDALKVKTTLKDNNIFGWIYLWK